MILYGPPTSGKDTITAELTRQDARFALLPKLKTGTGRTAGYRLVPIDELAALRVAGRLVVETRRYGNIYAVDRSTPSRRPGKFQLWATSPICTAYARRSRSTGRPSCSGSHAKCASRGPRTEKTPTPPSA